jgi:hypothetical protein
MHVMHPHLLIARLLLTIAVQYFLEMAQSSSVRPLIRSWTEEFGNKVTIPLLSQLVAVQFTHP